jgi:hypothetical protein
MSIAEWSELCLSAFPGVSSEVRPFWPFVAGLRALRFGRGFVLEAKSMVSSPRDDDPDARFVHDLIEFAPENPAPGLVLVMREDGTSIAATVDYQPERIGQQPGTPILALFERDLQMYTPALRWLASQKAITRLVYELEEDGLS